MIKKLEFQNYKGFKDLQEIEIKPITLLIGKNSSGKSSICKLLPILAEGFANPEEHFPLVTEDGIRLSHTYPDLFHKRDLTNLLFRLTEKDSTQAIELKYLIVNGEMCNFEDHKNVFCSKCTKSPLKKDSVTYIGPIRNHEIELLNKHDIANLIKPDGSGKETYGILLKSFLSDQSMLKKVGDWFETEMNGQRLVYKDINSNFGLIAPMIQRDGIEIHISEVGEGVSQVLPIIVKSFEKKTNRIVVLEQPALHLHPSVHSKISERLANSTQETGQKYIIESHSKTLMLGFVSQITSPNSKFSKNDLAIYYIEADTLPFSVRKIEVDENGEFDWWPSGLFEDDYELQEKILYKE